MSIQKMLVNPPDLEECENYAEFKRRVRAWKTITHVPENQRGAVLAYNLTNKSKFGPDLQNHVYTEHDEEALGNDTEGVTKVLNVLDKYLETTGIGKAAEKWDAFIDIQRKPGQTIKQFIGHFENILKEFETTFGTIKPLGKALHLLRTSKLSDSQYEMIMAMAGSHDETLIYDKIKDAVVCQLTDKINDIKGTAKEVRAETALIAEEANSTENVDLNDIDEEILAEGHAMAASFYKKQAWQKKQQLQNQLKNQQPGNRQQQFRQGSYRGRGTYQPASNNRGNYQAYNNSNPQGPRCDFCRARSHTQKDCSQYRKAKEQFFNNKRNSGAGYFQINVAENTNEEQSTGQDNQDQEPQELGSICLSENFSQLELSRFTTEALNCAALDTCCSQTVCGEKWLKIYLDNLPSPLHNKVTGPMPANIKFRFGNNQSLTSKEKWCLPIFLGDKLTSIEVYVISSDIPMLMSKSDLQKFNAILYMAQDKAMINGKMVELKTTSAGHFIVNLLEDGEAGDILYLEDIFAVNLLAADPKTQLKSLQKLHSQLGHRPKQAFISMLKHADTWDPSFSKMIDKIIDGCEGCILRRRNPDTPVVAVNMAKDVNDVVAIDLKVLKNGKYILYMVDCFSRFTQAKIIPNKQPDTIIDAIFEKWISWLGTPNKFLHDNGGEFCNELMLLTTTKLNIETCTTGANSPWSNGTCEVNHKTVDNILEPLQHDHPKVPLETLLLWALVAKNSMLMVQGFSPYQIMFGKNPKLPNIITDPLPTWDNEGISGSLKKHLESMKATREAFVKSEDSQKLKLALEAKIRTNNTVYHNGDWVYFKRTGYNNKWFSGKVVFQDGKVIFVRSGNYFYRCSANRIMKAGTELARQLEKDNDDFETADEGDSNTPDSPEVEPINASTNESGHDTPSTEERNNSSSNEAPGETTPNDTHPTLSDNTTHDQEASTDNVEEPIQIEAPDTNMSNEGTNNPSYDKTSTNTQHTPKAKKTKKKASKDPQGTTPPIRLKKDDLIELKLDGKWTSAVVRSNAGRKSGVNEHWYNIILSNGEQISFDASKIEFHKTTHESVLATWVHDEIFATMVSPEERNSNEALEAQLAELEKLKEFGVYQEVQDVGQETVSTVWVLTKKENEIRARLTARGFEEESNVHSDSPTVQSTSMRFLLMMAALKQWNIQSTDIRSAFLQGRQLDRDVFVKPPKEAQVAKGILWKLNKCLYGLNDASKMWYDEIDTRFIDHGFEQSCQDTALYIYKENDNIEGAVAIHVDDFMHAGTEHFNSTIIPKLLEGLVVGKTESKEFTYTGFHITQNENGILLDQKNYLENIEVVHNLDSKRLRQTCSPLTPEETTLLRQIMGKVNWVVRATRPDLSYDTVYLSTKFHNGTIDDVKEALKCIKRIQKTNITVNIPDLQNINDLEIWSFSDAAFGNISDKEESVGAHMIFLANKETGMAAPITWKAAKLKRAAQSTLEAEALALKDALNSAIGIQQIAEECFNTKITIFGVVDNYSTYEVVRSNKPVSNPRLRRDIFAIKQRQKQQHVDKIFWLEGQNMIVDCMTKKGKTGEQLLEVLQTGYLGTSMEAANMSEFVLTYDPKQDKERDSFDVQW